MRQTCQQMEANPNQSNLKPTQVQTYLVQVREVNQSTTKPLSFAGLRI